MLRRVGETVDSKDAVVKIKDASFPTPFVSALEYNSPVHGNWNIVHTGMQVPESIQIYVCADNCMRGVVLTAAEMNAAEISSELILVIGISLSGAPCTRFLSIPMVYDLLSVISTIDCLYMKVYIDSLYMSSKGKSVVQYA